MQQLYVLEDSESNDEAVCPLTLSYRGLEVLFSSLKFDTWANIHNFGTLILHMHKSIMLTIAKPIKIFLSEGVQLKFFWFVFFLIDEGERIQIPL